jgi:hypothetical protein
MARLSYDAMRKLILDNLARLPDIGVFTPELLTAIFWEETGFQGDRTLCLPTFSHRCL